MVDATDRRRLAILDGDTRHDLSLPLDATLNDALGAIGVRPQVGRDVLLEPAGREISPLLRADELADGTVLSVVDLSQRVGRGRRRPRRQNTSSTAASAWWLATGVAVVVSVLAVPGTDALPAAARPWIAAIICAGALASGVVFALRARSVAVRADAAAVAVLALAFAAGAAVVPPLPAEASTVSVFTGLVSVAVIAGLLGLLTRPPALHSSLIATSTLALVLAAVWGGALLLGIGSEPAAAVTLGLAPVGLRVLLSTLVDVPPGLFLDYERYQTTRWSVRQQLPEEIHSISSKDAGILVARSTGRLTAGTLALCLAAALAAPFAIPGFVTSDPLVLAGRIALAATTVLALLLGARRYSSAALRWLPRATAAIVLLVVVIALLPVADGTVLTIAAVACLAVGAGVAFAVVPAGRGAQSLFWSRFGDVIEWIAVALSLPASLLAADAVDLLRGMMGA